MEEYSKLSVVMQFMQSTSRHSCTRVVSGVVYRYLYFQKILKLTTVASQVIFPNIPVKLYVDPTPYVFIPRQI